MNKCLLSIVAITGVMLGDSIISQANANLITNGSFESGRPAKDGPNDLCPNNGKSYVCVKAGMNVISGWEVFDAIVPPATIPIDLVPKTFWRTKSGAGDWSIDLNGNDTGGVRQTITTQIGKKYELSFLMAGNPAGDPDEKLLDVTMGSTSHTFSFNSANTSFTQMGFLTKKFVFLADSTETVISFESITGNPTTVYGPVIDLVSVKRTNQNTPIGPGEQRPRSVSRIASSQRASVAVPENSSGFGVLAFGFLSAGLMLKDKIGRSGTDI